MRLRSPRLLDALTPAGRSVLLLGGVCYTLDTLGGWPVFRLMWVVCVLLCVAAVAMAALRSRAEVDLTLTPTRAIAGDTVEVRLAARSARWAPVPSPLVVLPTAGREHLLRLRMLRRGRVVEEKMELADLRRGVVLVGPAVARRTDPLALLRRDETWAPAQELLVLPRIMPVDSLGMGVIRDQEGTPSDEISMSDLAFHALREYVPGDELRHVHWRSSAKASTLQIRQYHDTRRSHLTVVLDAATASYDDPEDFETAVSVAASVAARAHRDGVEVSMLCGDHAVTGRGLDGVLDACCRIQLTDSDPDLAARLALRLAPETSWLVLVTGSAAPEELAGSVRSDLPSDVTLLCVRCDRSRPTELGSMHGTRLLQLRSLEELPRALAAAVQAAPA